VLISTVTTRLYAIGDQELLTQAVANLIENELHHTPPGTRIAVGLEAHGEPGVDEAELPRLTHRFTAASAAEPRRAMASALLW
jgi:signal transduction histidine kinase